jgi:Cu-processing system permease protein
MKPIFIIALNTFKESVRNKILYNILFLALGVIIFSVSVADWSVFERVQVMEDFGLATMSLTGLIMAVFIGVGLLGREIASKTVYMIVTKPIGRGCFLVGKFLGLLGVLLINFGAMALILWGALVVMGGAASPALLPAVALIWMELAIMIAAAMLFSSFSTPILSAIFTLAFYVGGHLNDLVSVELLHKRQPLVETLLRVVYYVLPNLEHFNIRTAVVYGISLPPAYVVYTMLYGLCYLTALLVLSTMIFRRRDL